MNLHLNRSVNPEFEVLKRSDVVSNIFRVEQIPLGSFCLAHTL